MGKGAFAKCNNLSLVFVEDGCTLDAKDYVDASVTISRMPQTPIQELRNSSNVVIPDGITGIGGTWFSYSNIETVVIPSTIETIGARAFC